MFAPWRSQNPVRKTWVSDYWKIIHSLYARFNCALFLRIDEENRQVKRSLKLPKTLKQVNTWTSTLFSPPTRNQPIGNNKENYLPTDDVVGGNVDVGVCVVVGCFVVVGACVVVGCLVVVGACVVVGCWVACVGSGHFLNAMSSTEMSPLKSPPRSPSK